MFSGSKSQKQKAKTVSLPVCFHLFKVFLLFSPVDVKGILSLLDLFFGGLKQMDVCQAQIASMDEFAMPSEDWMSINVQRREARKFDERPGFFGCVFVGIVVSPAFPQFEV